MRKLNPVKKEFNSYQCFSSIDLNTNIENVGVCFPFDINSEVDSYCVSSIIDHNNFFELPIKKTEVREAKIINGNLVYSKLNFTTCIVLNSLSLAVSSKYGEVLSYTENYEIDEDKIKDIKDFVLSYKPLFFIDDRNLTLKQFELPDGFEVSILDYKNNKKLKNEK